MVRWIYAGSAACGYALAALLWGLGVRAWLLGAHIAGESAGATALGYGLLAGLAAWLATWRWVRGWWRRTAEAPGPQAGRGPTLAAERAVVVAEWLAWAPCWLGLGRAALPGIVGQLLGLALATGITGALARWHARRAARATGQANAGQGPQGPVPWV
jgi:hypothetical protein